MAGFALWVGDGAGDDSGIMEPLWCFRENIIIYWGARN